MLTVAAGCRTPSVPADPGELWQPDDKDARRIEAVAPDHAPAPWATNATVSLQQLIEYALVSSPALRKSRAEARQAEAAMRQSRSAYYPSIDLTASGKAGRSDANALEKDADYMTYGPAASLSWLLLDAGGRGATSRAAFQNLLAANYTFNRSLQNLLLSVHTDYYALHSAQAAVAAAEASLSAAEKTLESARKRAEANLGIQLDVLRAKTDFEQAQYNLENARASVSTAKGQLAQTVGLMANAILNIAPPDAVAFTENDWPESRVNILIDAALAGRPDIQAARAAVLSAQYSVRAVSSDRWPSLTAGVQAEAVATRYSDDDFSDTDSQTVLGSLALSWNIFDGYMTLNKKREAESLLEAKREDLRAAELAVSQEVWSKYFALRSAIKKQGFAESALESAQQAYTQANDSYTAGLKDINFLLDAQSQLSNARSTVVTAENDVYTAYLDMLYALGDLAP